MLEAIRQLLTPGNVFAFGSVVLGTYIGYQAYRGFRRHESRPMQYLSIGLILLTAVSFGIAFVGTLLLRLRVIPGQFEQPLVATTRFLQFLGLAFIAYSMHRQ